MNFENPGDLNILPGMTAMVRAVVDPERAWTVPVTAAQSDENGQPIVWKIDPATMTVARAPVELGELVDDRVLIESGLAEGDMVAVSGVSQLREGMEVRAFTP